MLLKCSLAIDLRDPISFKKANLAGSVNVSHNALRDNMPQLPKDQPILVISEDGQKGHVALRMLKGAGFAEVYNLSGGYISLERYARAWPFDKISVGLLPVERKSVSDLEGEGSRAADHETPHASVEAPATGLLIIDVRTIEEFEMGAVEGAISLPLDELESRAEEVIGDKNREVIVYCASGARSGYARRVLASMGYTRKTAARHVIDIRLITGDQPCLLDRIKTASELVDVQLVILPDRAELCSLFI